MEGSGGMEARKAKMRARLSQGGDEEWRRTLGDKKEVS